MKTTLDLTDYLLPLVIEPEPEKRGGSRANSGGVRKGAGRKPKAAQAETPLERQKSYKARRKKDRHEKLAILDFETDPFDSETQGDGPLALDDYVMPFLAVLYPADLPHVVIWDDDKNAFTLKVIAAIEALPGSYTIFAHNGGKFDFLFLMKHIRGPVKFKGRALMTADVGRHRLRDSYHIIPERLANYKKDAFDYTKLKRDQRHSIRQQAIDYCVDDCRFLLEIVQTFVRENGLKLSIGQAALASLKTVYDNVGRLGTGMDKYLRSYFFGGRVECLLGKGHWQGDYKLYDVNSMYPYVMATRNHPIGGDGEWIVRTGRPGKNTFFLEIECDNAGALVTRSQDHETHAPYGNRLRFLTTIHEYKVAVKLGLIRNVRFLTLVDCKRSSDFADWIVPLYEGRQRTKRRLQELKEQGLREGDPEFDTVKRDDILLKLKMNNAYGKFAQNPRKFKEAYLTNVNEVPPKEGEHGEWFCSIKTSDYWLWERPCPSIRFNNVGTAASITGAARAVLLEALFYSQEPIYCDTDSIICRGLEASEGIEIDKEKLGAWDIEAEIERIVIVGKKQYAYFKKGDQSAGHKPRIKTKGVSGKVVERDPRTLKEIQMRELQFNHFERMLRDEIIEIKQNAPTISKAGSQIYMRRKIKATAPERILPNGVFGYQHAHARIPGSGRTGQRK